MSRARNRFVPRLEALEDRQLLSGAAGLAADPGKAVVRIEIVWDRNHNKIFEPGIDEVKFGSGFLIGPSTVATAAHNVVPQDPPSWFVITGKFNGEAKSLPSNVKGVAQTYSHDEYYGTPNQSPWFGPSPYDIAVIPLDRRVGAETGYYSYRPAKALPTQVTVIGYPGGSTTQTRLDGQLLQSANPGLWNYDMVVPGGTSGGPVLDLSNPKRPTVIGVNTSGSTTDSMGVRLTKEYGTEKFLKGMKNPEKYMRAIRKRADLSVSLEYRSTNPFDTGITPGSEVTVTARIYNGGNATAQNVDVRLIRIPEGQKTFLELGALQQVTVMPKETKTVEWKIKLPEGKWRLQSIVDPENKVPDQRKSNNWVKTKVIDVKAAVTQNPNSPNTPAKDDMSEAGLLALWEAIKLTKNAAQAHTLAAQFGTGADAAAWQWRPTDGGAGTFAIWGLLESARGLIKQAVGLLAEAASLRFPNEAERIRELNIAAQDLKDRALAMATEAHRQWSIRWNEYWSSQA